MRIVLTAMLLAVLPVLESAPALTVQVDSASIRGVVTSLGTAEPVVGAVVELTASEGGFEFGTLKPGSYRLVANTTFFAATKKR
jgi:hypothetical protein